MRKWEDIVKDRMEELDVTLPESFFAEFCAIRNGAAPDSPQRRFLPIWALVPAVAAGLAAFLFILHKPSTSENEVLRIVQKPANPVALINDSTEVVEPTREQTRIARVVSQQPVITEESGHEEKIDLSQEENKPAAPERAQASETEVEKKADEPVVTDTSPHILDNVSGKPVKIKVVPVAGGVIAGSGLLAAIISQVSGFGASKDYSAIPGDSPHELTSSDTHYFPFKGGVSVGLPLAERWKITTGLEYSRYQSDFTHPLSGEKKQLVQYLGVPVRLDWSLVNSGRFDVYVGGGIKGDYCISATLAGEKLKRDGFSFSVIGVGGLQFNIFKRIGLYVEPGLSWTVPSGGHVLETYRSERPFMFSVSTGLRINLGK